MTSPIERLLTLAATYEEKAKALRLAAAELNGQVTSTVPGRSETPGVIEPVLDTNGRTMLWMRDCLAKGPRTTTEIIDYLHTQGTDIGKHTARKLLGTMPDVKHTGATHSARWQLRGRAGKDAST